MKMISRLLGMMLALVAMAGTAQAGVHGAVVHHCRMTPADNTPSYPGKQKIIDSNNLAKPAGKSIFATGQLVYLSGRIVDRDCVPLKGAKVEVWHANPEGVYVNPDKGAFTNPYPLFAGSGEAIADNEGKFAFITTYPGPYSITWNRQSRIRAPHVSMRITHDMFAKPYNIEMYFEGDARNPEDPYFQQYKEPQRPLIEATVKPRSLSDINAGVQVYYDITLPEKDPFRRF